METIGGNFCQRTRHTRAELGPRRRCIDGGSARSVTKISIVLRQAIVGLGNWRVITPHYKLSAQPLRSLRLCGCRMCAPYFYRREAENAEVAQRIIVFH